MKNNKRFGLWLIIAVALGLVNLVAYFLIK